jgi:hypothetical protein
MLSKKTLSLRKNGSQDGCLQSAPPGVGIFTSAAVTAFTLFGLSFEVRAQGPGSPIPAAPAAPKTSDAQALAPTSLNAILTKIVGVVKVNGKPVTKPTLLQENQVVETGEGASASIFFGRDGIVHLSPDAKMKINLMNLEKRANGVDLEHGKARVLVRSGGASRSFTVRTRTATMGVRGTHILVDVPRDVNQAPRFVTFEGKAEVRPNLPPVQLQPGAAPPPPPPAITLTKQETVSVPAPGSAAGAAPGGSGAPSAGNSETRRMDSGETQRLASEVVPVSDIQTPGDVKQLGASDGGRENGTRGNRGEGTAAAGDNRSSDGNDGSRGNRGNRGNRGGDREGGRNGALAAGSTELLPNFGFGTNGGFGYTGGGNLLGQPGSTGAALDPVADGAGVARVTIQLNRTP